MTKKINALNFAKEFDSLDDYNFLKVQTLCTLPQDLFKKLVPNYEELEGNEYKIAMKVCSALIRELQANNRIVITDREKAEMQKLQQIRIQKERDLEKLANVYGLKKARVIMANVLTAYGNAGNPRKDYQTAKKWCEEQGIYNEIELRASSLEVGATS